MDFDLLSFTSTLEFKWPKWQTWQNIGLCVLNVFICPIAIAWDWLSNKFFCVCVCMYVYVCGHAVAYGCIFQPIFTKFGKNLWGLKRKNWLGWGRNPKMSSPILILTLKTPKFTAEIGNSRPNTKCLNETIGIYIAWDWLLTSLVESHRVVS